MTSRVRVAVALASTVWVVTTLVVATEHLMTDGPRRVLICRVLPNAWVPTTPAVYGPCPLAPYERIDMVRKRGGELHRVSTSRDLNRAVSDAGTSLEVRAVNGSERRWVSVPIVQEESSHLLTRVSVAWLVIGCIQALSLALIVASASPAIVPLSAFFSCVSVVLVWFLFGYESRLLAVLARPGYSLMPATIFHLAMYFPREREVIRFAPGIVAAPYALSVALWWVGQATVDRSPAVWALADRLVFLLTIVAASVCVFSCILAVRESNARMEKARAKVLLFGAAIALLVPIALDLSLGESIPASSMLLPILGVSMIPAFVGYAIARYHLFDLAASVRRVVALSIQVVAVSAVVASASAYLLDDISMLAGAPVIFAASLFFMGAAEVAKGGLRRAGDEFLSPWQARLSAVEQRYAESVASVEDVGVAAVELGEAISRALDPESVAIFVADRQHLQLEYANGLGPVLALDATVEEALGAVERTTALVQEEPTLVSSVRGLIEMGVEVVAPIRTPGELIGVAILGGRCSGVPYGSRDIAFLSHVAGQCATAVLGTRLMGERIVNERYAAIGRVESNLAHEIGKPLGVLQILASRLQQRFEAEGVQEPDVASIEGLAHEMRQTLRSLSDASSQLRREGNGAIDLIEVVQAAADRIGSARGLDVPIRVPPHVPLVAADRASLFRALVNLLENAALAVGDREGDVEVVVEVDENQGQAIVRVLDRGCGMSEESLRRAFDPFFSSREGTDEEVCSEDRGTGLGLPIARELVERQSGVLELRSEVGAGTTATVKLRTYEGLR